MKSNIERKVFSTVALGFCVFLSANPVVVNAMGDVSDSVTDTSEQVEKNEEGLNSEIKKNVEKAKKEFNEVEGLKEGENGETGQKLEEVEKRIDELDKYNSEAQKAIEDYKETAQTIGAIVDKDAENVSDYADEIEKVNESGNSDVEAIVNAINEIEEAANKTYYSEADAEVAKKNAEATVEIAEKAAANAAENVNKANELLVNAEIKKKEADDKVEVAQKAYDEAKAKVQAAQANLRDLRAEYYEHVIAGGVQYDIPNGALRDAVDAADDAAYNAEQEYLDAVALLDEAMEEAEQVEVIVSAAQEKFYDILDKRDKVVALVEELKSLAAVEVVSEEELKAVKKTCELILDEYNRTKTAAEEATTIATKASSEAEKAGAALNKEGGFVVVRTETSYNVQPVASTSNLSGVSVSTVTPGVVTIADVPAPTVGFEVVSSEVNTSNNADASNVSSVEQKIVDLSIEEVDVENNTDDDSKETVTKGSSETKNDEKEAATTIKENRTPKAGKAKGKVWPFVAGGIVAGGAVLIAFIKFVFKK